MTSSPDRWHRWLLDVRPVAELAAKVEALYASLQPPGSDPVIDFDERDLLRCAGHAGFPEIRLDLEITVANAKQPVPWGQFLRTSGNPLVPRVGEALDRPLTPREIAQFTACLKPLVESGTGQERRAVAYLTAVRQKTSGPSI